MKLSLAWMFDHIRGNWKTLDIGQFVRAFTSTITELDFHTKVTFNLDNLFIGRVTKINGQVFVFIPELNKECVLPERDDVVVGGHYLIRNDKKTYQFATMLDFGSEKDLPLPALSIRESFLNGSWRELCEREDIILTLDNKSVTNRPDLWGHRGFAREVAAMLDLEMIPEDRLIVQTIIKNYHDTTPKTDHNPISLSIQAPDMCDRLAGLYLSDVTVLASIIHPAQRLARIDARPINSIVDATNYVMYDIGQPLHAFDADELKEGILIVRPGGSGEKVTLLDGQAITVEPSDCVIADGKRALSLAGIMGGQDSGISPKTSNVLFESAHFNPVFIRRSSTKFKKRSEASARFEKGLDPNQNTLALMRAAFLLDAWGIPHVSAKEIDSIGKTATEKTVEVPYDFFSKKIGMPLSSDLIKRTIQKLGFGVQENKNGLLVTVPTNRLKDVAIKEDVVEEVARFVGYENVPHKLPVRAMKPFDYSRVTRIRDIKNHCAFAFSMHELCNYPLYDEEFIGTLGWQPQDGVLLSNPVSENWRMLVTSLVPHLLKALKLNSIEHQQLGFFEWGRVWKERGDGLTESRRLALVWYQGNGDINFYDCKSRLATLFSMLGAPVLWVRNESKSSEPWFHPFESAELMCNDRIVGTAGKISPFFLGQFLSHGDIFIAELDGDFLETYTHADYQFEALSTYPRTDLDVSVFVPVTLTVEALEKAVAGSDARIKDVFLIDFYEKSEWDAYRSITLRYVVADDFKTLTKDEIEEISHGVTANLKALGVTIR